ncbi:hypothetical protein [Agromyces archimandritae]|uniref:DUF8094 domain-containing protein n=1 Tax=Agromyces archimandritae TaxID=2781962 RepID=A0A975IPZ2_9MICO|nr:hypothetical protein [Agromyces archimandritae]QTX04506.1 hypothetical protein G127AT_14765 [Agromyces archimandritae]
MRFVFAIGAFLAAAVLIGLGIAQRTVFLEPDRVETTIEVSEDAGYLVISEEALQSHDGKQTIGLSGAEQTFMAYGSTGDVEAWIGEAPYTRIGFDAETQEFTSELVEPEEAARPGADAAADAEAEEPQLGSPAGSDLWLEEYTGEASLARTIDVPEGFSVIAASDGTAPAPSEVTVRWPLDNSTPWVGPLLTAGTVFFLIGAYLLITGFIHHRRGRGPRRNLPKGPRPSRLPSAPRPTSVKRRQLPPAGRRSIGRAPRTAAVASLGLASVLALSACSAEYWPSFDSAPETATPTPTPSVPVVTDAAEEADSPKVEIAKPAVTSAQLERILADVSKTAQASDEELSAEKLKARFTGPAMQVRDANYRIRTVLPDQPAAVSIPAEPVKVVLPQQASAWPRNAFVVVETEDEKTPPTAMMLTQADPRSNYKVVYAVAMAAEPEFPKLAPASVGAPLLSPEAKGLVVAPASTAGAYADLLTNGDKSKFAELFEQDGDNLLAQLGVAGQQKTMSETPATATLSFQTVAGKSPSVALGTVDAGALVVGTVEQTEQARPNDGGTIAFAEGGPRAAVSGFSAGSAKGVQHTTGVQVLFYVPGVGSDEKIRVLGWSESLIAASEVK